MYRLLEFSEATGVPLQKCIDEALDEWLACCAAPRMEAMTQPRTNVIQFPRSYATAVSL
jgi:hypothetical protein